MSNKVLISIVGVILAITILVIGIVIGKRISNEANVPADNLQQKYFQAGWDAAKAKYDQVCSRIFVPINPTDDVIAGVINRIEGNKLTLAIGSLDSLGDPKPAELKTITVADSTKITVAVPQDPEEIEKKIKEENIAPIRLMFMTKYKEASLSDLKTNQFITISASNGSEKQAEFTANEIRAEYVAPEAIQPEDNDSSSQK